MKSTAMKVTLLGTMLLSLTACTDDPETVQPYDRAPVPAVPDRTTAIREQSVMVDGSLAPSMPDGDYWAEASAVGSGRPFIMFDLSQALFGQTCFDELGESACANDYGVISEPHGTLSVLWDSLQSVTVVAESRQNYAVPGAELASLIGGNAPSADAPDDYSYVPFPFLVTVRDGAIVDVHQIWVP